ncbi:MAG: hypothetical protein AAB542_00805 [Patescibacteria group bacterium]
MTTPEQNTGSTGGSGLDRRTFNRWYDNYRFGIVHSLHGLERFALRGQQAIERQTETHDRSVGRFLVGNNLLQQAIASEKVAPFIEVVVPTELTVNNGSGRERVWMMMGAVNHPRRQSPFTVDTIVRDVDRSVQHTEYNRPKTPLERIRKLRSQGYLFIRDIPKGREDELLRLWETTFDWTREGIDGLQSRLQRERSLAPAHRGAWFTGLINSRNNELVAAATAERLDIPVGDGRILPLVESTEWRRSDNAARGGLMAGAVSHLHGQVLQDLETYNPLIVAEANYWSEAHNVGLAAGMVVPSRNMFGRKIPQTLMQNVRVGDGKIPDGLRDFTMMYLPPMGRRSLYNRASRAAILQEGGV